jgi:hypothetical protein
VKLGAIQVDDYSNAAPSPTKSHRKRSSWSEPGPLIPATLLVATAALALPCAETSEACAEAIVDEVLAGHLSMVAVMARRLRMLRVVKSKWSTGPHLAAVVLAIEFNDLPLVVDLLQHGLLQNQSDWTLDIAATLLPSCRSLLQSDHESYTAVACSALEVIAVRFGDKIRTTDVPTSITVPLDAASFVARVGPGEAERRRETCVRCRTLLKDILGVVNLHLLEPRKGDGAFKAMKATFQAIRDILESVL